MTILNAFTVDVEDYFQVQAFNNLVDYSSWDSYSLRVVQNTQLILKILKEYDTRATFFVLGWIAEKCPDLVKEIASHGHEIASHGYSHQLVYNQTPEEFDRDIYKSLTAIHAACSEQTILGYRAPTFSITDKSMWALDILQKYNLEYDSSISPTSFHDSYGVSDSSRFSYLIKENLLEIPVSTVCVARKNIPVAGGGYFRLFPRYLTAWGIKKINLEGKPVVFYLHPWEVDPSQPRMQGASRISKFRHYINLHKTEARLRYIFENFKFSSIKEVFLKK